MISDDVEEGFDAGEWNNAPETHWPFRWDMQADEISWIGWRKMPSPTDSELIAANAQFGPLDHTKIAYSREIECLVSHKHRLEAEVKRLNAWADSFSEAQMKERRLSEEVLHDAMREKGKLRDILRAVDHTLSVHGHIDADTPLHDRIRAVI